MASDQGFRAYLAMDRCSEPSPEARVSPLNSSVLALSLVCKQGIRHTLTGYRHLYGAANALSLSDTAPGRRRVRLGAPGTRAAVTPLLSAVLRPADLRHYGPDHHDAGAGRHGGTGSLHYGLAHNSPTCHHCSATGSTASCGAAAGKAQRAHRDCAARHGGGGGTCNGASTAFAGTPSCD